MAHSHHLVAVGPRPRSGLRRDGARRAVSVAVSLMLALGWLLVHPLSAVADGPTTFSNSASIAIPATGSAQQIGPASPYPSSISVSGMAGPVSKVTVTFHNLSHTSLGDVDALLVAPSNENLVVLSDAGPQNALSYANNATITFDDSAASTIGAGSVPSGSFQVTNNSWQAADSFPAPAPSPSNHTTLAGAFSGINPNGTWQLFVVDDTTGDVGVMSGGWSLTITTETAAVATTTTVTSSDASSTTGDPVTFTASVRADGSAVNAGSVQFNRDGTNLGAPVPVNGSGNATLTTSSLAEGTHLIRATYSGATGLLTSNGTVSQRVDNATTVTDTTFCNTGVIATPERGTAAAYPSNVFVTGLSGQVTKVTAQLKGLSHTAPIDFDILLSGPTPTRNVFLMSDSGGQNPVSNVNLTFDDAAASTIGNSLASGIYRPTRTADESVENLPAPAPALSGATTLSTFNGASGNGTWSLWVVDDATGDSGSISGGWCVTITSAAPTTTALSTEPNPSVAGQSVTFTATVASGGHPVTTGSVQFSDGAATLGAPVAVDATGTATLTTSALTAGSHTITADYGGTATLGDSTDTVTQVVRTIASTTTLTSAPNPSIVGQSVTFTATVTTTRGPVTDGTVSFSEAGTEIAVVPVNAAGQAVWTTNTFTQGTRHLIASYSGTATIASSSDSVDQVVNRIASTTALTSDRNPSTVGDPVTFTATVTSASGPAGAGTVTFRVDGAPQAPVSINADGRARLTTSALGAGTHTIEAAFSGSGYLNPSTDSLDQVVGQQASTTTVTSSPNPAAFGATVTFTATVTAGGAPVSSGTVQFSVGGTPVGTPLQVAADGTATLSQAGGFEPGTFTMTATFSGTANVAGSSGSVNQVVEGRPTSTVVTGPGNSDLGTEVTFTATVTSAGAPVTAGGVVFAVDGNPVGGEVGVDGSGQATFTTADLAYGNHTVAASFTDPADGYQPSSGNVGHTVSVQFNAHGPYQVAEGESLTLAGTGSPGAGFGWDLNGDGDYSDATGLTPTLTWAQLEALGINDGPSSHPIRLQVNTGAQLSSTDTTLTVSNTAPQSVLTGDLTATVGRPFTIKVGADDPSSVDLAAQFTYTIDWGDGSPAESVVGPADPPVTHTYATEGTFDATFTATDKDGGVGPGQTVQVVAAAATSPSPSPSPSLSPSPSPSPTSTNGTGNNGGGNLPQTGADADLNRLFLGFGLLALGALATVTGLITRAVRRRG